MEIIAAFIIIALVLFSGLFSGLTLGLLGLDKSDLERKIKAGNKNAKKVYSVRKDGNLLLCTLLLGNVLVNSILSVFLGQISTGVVAVVVSTGLIVIFGEILPQAGVSRYALLIGSKTVWIVKFFRFILFPVCFPIAKTLDWMLGEEMPTIWSRRELEEIIKTHEDSKDSAIDADEERIIIGALNFSNKKVREVMTPSTVTFMIEANRYLSKTLMREIKKNGFTRIPVYEERYDNIKGILYTKDLIGLNKKVKTSKVARNKNILEVDIEDNLDDLLNKFIKKKTHIALVFDEFGTFQGIITLEDVLEEILQREIVDEADSYSDMRKVARDMNK